MKSGIAIEVTYQAAGSATGLADVKMDVYDEAHAIDASKGVAAMIEIGTTGRYYASFTPDAEGEWTVLIDSITAPGKIVKKYSVVGHDVDSVGDAVAVTDGKVDAVDGKVDTAIAGVVIVDGKVDALENISTSDVQAELGTYDAATGAEVASVDGKIDALNDIAAGDVTGGTTVAGAVTALSGGSETLEIIKNAVDSVGTPPMVG